MTLPVSVNGPVKNIAGNFLSSLGLSLLTQQASRYEINLARAAIHGKPLNIGLSTDNPYEY